jgi:hypothetical protein
MKAVGLAELRHISYERGQLTFPYDFPGTPQHTDYNNETNAKFAVRYFQRPSAHRPNYGKIGSYFPLLPDPSVFGDVIQVFVMAPKRLPKTNCTLYLPHPDDTGAVMEPLH